MKIYVAVTTRYNDEKEWGTWVEDEAFKNKKDLKTYLKGLGYNKIGKGKKTYFKKVSEESKWVSEIKKIKLK